MGQFNSIDFEKSWITELPKEPTILIPNPYSEMWVLKVGT